MLRIAGLEDFQKFTRDLQKVEPDEISALQYCGGYWCPGIGCHFGRSVWQGGTVVESGQRDDSGKLSTLLLRLW